jgi:hypothetical protein
VHVLLLDAPVDVEYVPLLHLIQREDLLAPKVLEYVPAGQFMHVLLLDAPLDDSKKEAKKNSFLNKLSFKLCLM